MPMVGAAIDWVTARATGSTIPSITMAKAPASAMARASASSSFCPSSLLALHAKAAHRVDRLRGQPDMAHHRHAAADQERHRLRHVRAALQLDRAGAGLLQHARGVAERLLAAFLVGAERHVDDDQRALRAAHHRPALQDHHVERDRHGRLQPVHDHAERVADQDEVAIAVDDPGRVRVIGGERDDPLAVLASGDIDGGDAADRLSRRPSGERAHADQPDVHAPEESPPRSRRRPRRRWHRCAPGRRRARCPPRGRAGGSPRNRRSPRRGTSRTGKGRRACRWRGDARTPRP